MEALAEKRDAINDRINMAFICNACNMEMTHAKQVMIRRAQLIQVARDKLYELRLRSADLNDLGLTIVGMVYTQAWLNSMQMHTRYEVWSMAELWQLDIANPQG